MCISGFPKGEMYISIYKEMNVSNLDDIVAQAQANANQLVVTDAAVPLPTSVPNTSTAVYDMSDDAFLNRGGMSVDGYVAVKPAGIRLDKDWQGHIDDFDVVIDMNDVRFFMGIQKTIGTNVTYAKSYDGKTTAVGENFQQIVAEFKRDSQKKADPYPGADIPMTITQKYADPKDAKKTIDPETTLGLTTSITGFKPWQAFHRKIKSAGLDTSVLKVKVSHSPRKNAAGPEYGVCEFDLIEIVDDNRPKTAAPEA